jgi:regulatory protein
MGDTPPTHEERAGEAGEPPPRTEHLELAYRYLNRRERTEAELRRHLEGRDLDAGAVQATVTALREQGYLDDARFARLFAQDKRELEHWGTERIRRTLLERGVERGLVDAAIDQAPPEDELARAQALLRRRFPSWPLDRRERERAFGVLLRKGFDNELALEVLTRHEPDALP